MIQGHGDDLYRYGNRVEINFSTNIFNHFDHSPLFDFLARKLHLITSYPEPEPTTLEQAHSRRHLRQQHCPVALQPQQPDR